MFPKNIRLLDTQVVIEAHDLGVRTDLVVVLSAGVGLAQVNAFLPMTTGHARELAKALNEAADEAEQEDTNE